MDASDRIKIRGFVAELLSEHDDRAAFADAESLIRAGRLASFAVVKLVAFLEQEFAVDFTRIEFDPQRFDSIDEIAAMVAESRAEA